MGNNPSYFSTTGAGRQLVDNIDTRRLPVEQVSWENAAEFCRRLSTLPAEKEQGRVYRLPTEAEWESACRGLREQSVLLRRIQRAATESQGRIENIPEDLRKELMFYFGADSTKLDDHTWYRENADTKTHLVESRKPNPIGLYDMYGNVSEWCTDWYGHSFYEAHYEYNPLLKDCFLKGILREEILPRDLAGFSGDVLNPTLPCVDPKGPTDEDVQRMNGKAGYWGHRVIRGGSWNDDYLACRSDSRSHFAPDKTDKTIGFRVVFTRASAAK